MPLARKGSRRIRVGDTDYRWVVAPDSGYMHLVVEAADCPAQRLAVLVDYGDSEIPAADVSPSDIPQRAVTPAFVRRCIEFALASDWRPTERGPGLRLRLRGDEFEATR